MKTIGTRWSRRRSSRHTSNPDTSGSATSSRIAPAVACPNNSHAARPGRGGLGGGVGAPRAAEGVVASPGEAPAIAPPPRLSLDPGRVDPAPVEPLQPAPVVLQTWAANALARGGKCVLTAKLGNVV